MARTLQSFLASPELARIARMAATLRQLDAHWQKRLPSELAQHSRVISLEAGTLLVSTRSGGVAAKLRQLETRLVAQLSEMGLEINAIRIKVQVETRPFELKKPNRNLVLSPKALQALASGTAQLADSPAKEALLRLIAKRRGGQ